MKQLILICSLACFAMNAQAQMFFDFGLKGAFGPTVLFNNDIFDSGDYRHDVTMGFGYGAKFGVNFNGQNAITLDYMRMGSKQDLLFDLGPTEFTNAMAWDHNDFILMYRYTGYGAFIEIGPKYSTISQVTHAVEPSPLADASQFYEKSYLSGVFGFGSGLIGSELVSLQIGIRIHFGIDDIVNEQGRGAQFPTPGFNLNESKSLATAAMLNLEFNYAFGRFAKAGCSGRRRLILFE